MPPVGQTAGRWKHDQRNSPCLFHTCVEHARFLILDHDTNCCSFFTSAIYQFDLFDFHELVYTTTSGLNFLNLLVLFVSTPSVLLDSTGDEFNFNRDFLKLSSVASSTSSESTKHTTAEHTTSTPESSAQPRFTTSKVVVTSTLPNGGVSTVTQLTIVAASGDATAAPASKSTVEASLQSNAARRSLQSSGLGVGVAIGGAGILALGLI
ncbi:hypothetical protein DH86_00001972 [Scytalidium sp. 3C]|nr:hypothetical protein DH86_00001972 [Scytalidium sp. 3C]